VISFLLHWLITFFFRICISLVQFTRQNFFCQFIKRTQYISMSKFLSNIILSITIAFLVAFRLLNPNWSSPSTPCNFPRSSLCCMCDEADCAAFAAFCSFCLTFSGSRSDFHQVPRPLSSFTCVVIICVIVLRSSSPNTSLYMVTHVPLYPSHPW
jgi:hypothetical protein